MHLYKHWALFLTLWTSLGYGYSLQELKNYNIQLDVAKKTALLPITASIRQSGSYYEINFGTTEFNPITVTEEQGHYRLDVDGDRYTVLLPHAQLPMPGSALPTSFVQPAPPVSVVPPPVPHFLVMDASGHIDTLSEKVKGLQQEKEQLTKTNQALEQELQKQSNRFEEQIAALNRQLSEATRPQRQNENPAQRQEEPEPSEQPAPWPEVPSTIHVRNQGTQTPRFNNEQQGMTQTLRQQVREQSRQINQLSKALVGKKQALAASQETVRKLNLKLFDDSEQYGKVEKQLLEQIKSIKLKQSLSMVDEISPAMEPSPTPPLAEEAGAAEKVAAEKVAAARAQAHSSDQGDEEMSEQNPERQVEPENNERLLNQSTTAKNGDRKGKNKGKKKGKKFKAPSKKRQSTGDDSSASTEVNDKSVEPEVGDVTNTSHSDKLPELPEDEARSLLDRLSDAIPALRLAEKKGKKRRETQDSFHNTKALNDYMERLFKLKEEHSEINLDQHYKVLGNILQDQIIRSIGSGDGIYPNYLDDAINRYLQLFINFRKLHEHKNLWRVIDLLTLDQEDAVKINVLNIFHRLLKENWPDLRIGLWQVIAQTYKNFQFEHEDIDGLSDYLSNLLYALFAEDFTMITALVHGLRRVNSPNNYGLQDHVSAFVKGNDERLYSNTGAISILRDFQMIECLMNSIADNASRGRIWSELDVTAVAATIVQMCDAMCTIVKNLSKYMPAVGEDQGVKFFNNDESDWDLKRKHIQRRVNIVKRLKEDKPDLSKPVRLLSQFQAHLAGCKYQAGFLNLSGIDPIERFSILGFQPNYTPGDGLCLFHALVQQLSGVEEPKQEDSLRLIRQLIEFAQKQSDYSDTFGHINTELQEGEDLNSLNAVVNQLLNAQSIESPLQQESWGGHEILGLVSNYLDRAVLVIQANHTMSDDGSIALLFEPGGSEPSYLNFIETLDYIEVAFWDGSMPVTLGFLQGNPNTGDGNHWFELLYNISSETSSDLYGELDLEVSDCDRGDRAPGQCSESCLKPPEER
ncbi:OTU domain-containing protein [Endozoicomonas euniceicola]|uniref:OTU domain-containing protein n=1 Tax=Endozoicomonas euniceicola TaxID=1234143 RepID=A0ABY6GSP2_9GAMM|nr:hypothetical protein [Endozoicomonas euniceicola]UYM15775.1 hypothetical protein NX720_23595 [Endozoicomonas euniceicola]